MLMEERERLLRLERRVDQLGLNPDTALTAQPTTTTDVELPSSFYDALHRGGNIVEAVKIYRDITGVGLADAKKAIARANS
jgi:ribosomal protein L7/L12